MRSAIWKLSALATVIGLGLVAVVMQQRGLSFGTPAGKGVAETKATAAAPKPNVPGGGGKPEAKAPEGDPFEAAASPDDDNTAPVQLGEVSDGTSDPALQASTTASGEGDDSDFATQGTKPRIKPRALNFKDNVGYGAENGDPANAEVAEVETAPGVGRRNRSRGNDPAEMEGTAAGDQEPASDDDADPFQKHKQALARQTAGSRSRANVDDSAQGARQRAEAAGAAQGNPFDQDSGASAGGGPVVPTGRNPGNRSRGNLIDEGEPISAEPVHSAASDVVNDTVGYQSTAAPAGYRAQGGATGARTTASGTAGNRGTTGTRPQIGDEEDFKVGAGTTSSPTGVSQLASPNDSTRPNTIEAIPKISRDLSNDANPSLPPVISKSAARSRPNPLADDGDEGLTGTPRNRTQGNAFDNPGTSPRSSSAPADEVDSAFPSRKSANPSRHVLEIEPDPRPALTGTPDAAASRSMDTDVVPVPQRLAAAATYPAMGAGGRKQVEIVKRAPPTAYVGQPLVYQIFVRNIGSGPAQEVVVEDVVPEGVTMQGSIPQAELTGRKLAWRIGTLAAGEERKVSVKVIPGATGAIGSAATVKFIADQKFASADGVGADPIIPTVTTPRTASRTSPRAGTGVLLDLQGPRQAGLGQTFEVRFRLTNRTGQPLNDLLVRSMLPGNLLHESRVQDLEYRVGTLAAGESREVPLSLTAFQAGRADTRVMVMSGDDQILQTDNFVLDITGGSGASNVRAVGAESSGTPQLAVDVVPPSGPIRVGERVLYEIRLINRGSAPVHQAAVRLMIPGELKLVNAGPNKYRYEGADIVFDAIPVLEAGQQSVVKAEFTAQAAGETYINVQFVGSHMKRPLSRDEGLTIGR